MSCGCARDVPLVSVVVPCYNEEDALPLYAAALDDVSRGLAGAYAVELVLVDDGSGDGTLSVMKALSEREGLSYAVRWFALSRNFGKEAALLAGLQQARGDFVVTMDADMQDPPGLLPEMLGFVRSGAYDSVATCRVNRDGEPPVRSMLSRAFYKIMNRLSDVEMKDGSRDYRLMTRSMVDAVLSLSERNRFTKGIYAWVGFRTRWLPYENVERAAGQTKWSFFKLFRYAVEGIVAFSTVPLVIVSLLGLVLCAAALLFTAFVIVRAWLFGDPVAGWPSLMAAILMVGGVQLLCLGVIGQYLAKAYVETKRRPLYLIRESGSSAGAELGEGGLGNTRAGHPEAA